MKFAWIQTEKASYPLTKLCRWLGVTLTAVRLASSHTSMSGRLLHSLRTVGIIESNGTRTFRTSTITDSPLRRPPRVE